MPSWQPNWDDVRFDHVAAEEAAAACDAAALVTTAVVEGTTTQRAPVIEDWTGRYRDDFDDEEPLVGADLRATRDDLNRLAARIRAAAEAATVEQARRVADRERWHAEDAAERAERARVARARAQAGGRNIPI